ncbi:MAG TPA: cytochrome c [Gemmatimonadaceae bacterium]|nr:cytochrome c [Gemmatimonadaceae bacterium]
MTLFILAGCRPSDARESRDYERMRRQQRYDVFDTSGVFPDGKASQAPPAHTMTRQAAFVEPASQRPLDPTFAATQFARSCAPCHGAGGFGGGPIAPNLAGMRPPSLRQQMVAAMPTDSIVAVITNGYGRMIPLGWQLPPAARVAVASYVHSLNSVPSTAATRDDSAAAAYLRRLDSLNAAHAGLDAVLRLRRGPR